MTLFLADPDFSLYNGDALEVLKTLEDGSVQMCVTSPPFYGLRDYGTGSWVGGTEPEPSTCPACNADGGPCDMCGSTGRIVVPCHHEPVEGRGVQRDPKKNMSQVPGAPNRGGNPNLCRKCGARRVDQQIGLEETPEAWCEKLVGVFREVRRVLRADGTLWVEVGDSYASGPGGPQGRDGVFGEGHKLDGMKARAPIAPGYKQKDLIGAPWALAFALRADGWYLRSDIVWSRPNPMPESVTDRPTKSHSYIFMLSKSKSYFWDQEAIREAHAYDWTDNAAAMHRQNSERRATIDQAAGGIIGSGGRDRQYINGPNPAGRNVRSVWDIPTQPYPEAHFATYPEELVRRCILAGSSERGCCPECGAPWRRVLAKTATGKVRNRVTAGLGNEHRRESHGLAEVEGEFQEGVVYRTTGWAPSCTHNHEPGPCTVLDPFCGSGTTALVARKHGRRTIGIELSADYCELAARRLQQQSLFA